MGLFRKSYADKIRAMFDRIDGIKISDDDLLLKFDSKAKELKDYDLECIRLF
jgi:hypothetical protein